MPSTAARFVRNLTHSLRVRRETVVSEGLSGFAMAAICICIASPMSAAAAASWQSLDEIANTAESFLLERIGNATDNTSVEAGMLDRRLKLAECSQSLTGFLRPGTKIGPRTVVGVRCEGAKPWKIYVPVVMSVRTQVWVARQPLPRGHLLRREDLVADTRDVARMTAGYVSDPNRLVGQRLRSSILAGRVLTLKLLEANDIVSRGQTVTLTVSAGGVAIRMTGKALMDGALNQRIRVENLNSGRVVEGIVRSPEIVEILVPGSPDLRQETPKVSAPLADTQSSNNDR